MVLRPFDCRSWARSRNKMVFVCRESYLSGGGRKKTIQEEILKSLLRDFCKSVRISCMSRCFCGMGEVPVVLGRKHLSQLEFLQLMPLNRLPEENVKLGGGFSLGGELAGGGLICVAGCFRWPFANCQQILDLLIIYICALSGHEEEAWFLPSHPGPGAGWRQWCSRSLLPFASFLTWHG